MSQNLKKAPETNKTLKYLANERVNRGLARMIIDALEKESNLDLNEIKSYMRSKYQTLFESDQNNNNIIEIV
jgi:hypothetical protein